MSQDMEGQDDKHHHQWGPGSNSLGSRGLGREASVILMNLMKRSL